MQTNFFLLLTILLLIVNINIINCSKSETKARRDRRLSRYYNRRGNTLDFDVNQLQSSETNSLSHQNYAQSRFVCSYKCTGSMEKMYFVSNLDSVKTTVPRRCFKHRDKLPNSQMTFNIYKTHQIAKVSLTSLDACDCYSIANSINNRHKKSVAHIFINKVQDTCPRGCHHQCNLICGEFKYTKWNKEQVYGDCRTKKRSKQIKDYEPSPLESQIIYKCGCSKKIQKVALLRYWNHWIRDHFYTTNPHEIGTTKLNHVGRHGYKFEGVMGYLSKHTERGFVPFYRYWNPHIRDHLYTTNPHEIGTTRYHHWGRHGFMCEGVIGFISAHSDERLRPLYRYWSPHQRDHLYTIKQDEIGATIRGQWGLHGYVCEGIAGYVYSGSEYVRMYRYWSPHQRDHLYTNNHHEIGPYTPGHWGRHGYICEISVGLLSGYKRKDTLPLYRYWNPHTRDHLYTQKKDEIGSFIRGRYGKHGYYFEETLGYIWTNKGKGRVPVFRYWNPHVKDHLYTQNIYEIGTVLQGLTGKFGYICEGIIGYVVNK